ncbi:MAG TPA: putative lipid II flippase FtsW [Candidatus Paceibacterota bacterium]|nr:putative lipid II flippase FtsW [Verrucomicrobiota bacterium]HSA11505.1 putative lipid II flippase FtsW [Candidatus Paceibacterota bacterium]
MKVSVTILVSCVAALLSLGMVMLYSSSMAQVGAHYLRMQLVWCGLGLAACVVAALLDYRQLRWIWWLPLGLALLMLGLVLNPHIGAKINGARRWFSFGGMRFQPSEFAKIALIIALAWYGERFQRQMPLWKRGILIPGLLIVVTVGLIFIEPDVGNALVLAAVSSTLLLISGVRLRYFLPPVIAGVIAIGTFICYNPMRSDRIHSWLHVEETRRDTGLQAYQAMVALGSGGLTGKGLGDGRQKLGFLPEHHTDFIFSIIGEELGLIATLLVVAAFIAIVFCGAHIAMNAADTFGMLLGSGITFLIGMQAFINIGVVTSALPNKGLPLPFISYGGSNLLMTLTSVGLLVSIARQARNPDGVIRNVLISEEAENPFSRRAQAQP